MKAYVKTIYKESGRLPANIKVLGDSFYKEFDLEELITEAIVSYNEGIALLKESELMGKFVGELMSEQEYVKQYLIDKGL